MAQGEFNAMNTIASQTDPKKIVESLKKLDDDEKARVADIDSETRIEFHASIIQANVTGRPAESASNFFKHYNLEGIDALHKDTHENIIILNERRHRLLYVDKVSAASRSRFLEFSHVCSIAEMDDYIHQAEAKPAIAAILADKSEEEEEEIIGLMKAEFFLDRFFNALQDKTVHPISEYCERYGIEQWPTLTMYPENTESEALLPHQLPIKLHDAMNLDQSSAKSTPKKPKAARPSGTDTPMPDAAENADEEEKPKKLRSINAKYLPDDEITLTKNPEHADSYRTSYHFRKPLQESPAFGLVILDEAHTARNRESCYFQAVSMLDKEGLLWMTGTALYNSLSDIVAPLMLMWEILGIDWDYHLNDLGGLAGASGDKLKTQGIFFEMDPEDAALAKMKTAYDKDGQRLWMMCPGLFEDLGRRGNWGTGFAHEILRMSWKDSNQGAR
ncbi:hypothetical protein HJFPF1_06634 [Paramyrothecium foliicola]|nr:hypothetical protein HJFPF1_06634 [Paramyrothecium foliicola]